jgi:hypothetical protein
MRWVSSSDERTVYLTSRENKEAQHMRMHSRVNKVHSQGNKDTMYSEVSAESRSILSFDKKTVVDQNKEWYYSRETRGIPGPAASISSVSRDQKKTCPVAIKSPSLPHFINYPCS